MQELLNDPETIPFARRNKVCLGLLKKEMDRRVVKIRSLLGATAQQNLKIVAKESKECQTEQQIICHEFNSPCEDLSKILSPNTSILNMLNQQNDKKYPKRSSLPVSKQKNLKLELHDCSNIKKDYTKVSEYLSIKKRFAHALDSDDSCEKKFIQNSQDDRIFESQEFALVSGFNGFRLSQTNIDIQRQNLHIPLKCNQSDEEQKMGRSDYSNSFICNKRHSNFGSKPPSVKKIRFTDRTAADYEKRFILTEECKNRMLNLVNKMRTKNRRETQDWKLRENIIKKIDEKYGEPAI